MNKGKIPINYSKKILPLQKKILTALAVDSEDIESQKKKSDELRQIDYQMSLYTLSTEYISLYVGKKDLQYLDLAIHYAKHAINITMPLDEKRKFYEIIKKCLLYYANFCFLNKNFEDTKNILEKALIYIENLQEKIATMRWWAESLYSLKITPRSSSFKKKSLHFSYTLFQQILLHPLESVYPELERKVLVQEINEYLQKIKQQMQK